MVLLHSHLVAENFYAPKIIVTKKGETHITLSNKKHVIYSFLEGKQLIWNKESNELDDTNISKVARVIRNLHSVTMGINRFSLPKLSFGKKSNLDCFSALHFDLTKNNIFIGKNKRRRY